jgi:hypothetical protein
MNSGIKAFATDILLAIGSNPKIFWIGWLTATIGFALGYFIVALIQNT